MIPTCIVLVLGFAGITMMFRSDPPPVQSSAGRSAHQRKPAAVRPAFDAARALRGQELHARLVAEAKAHPHYRNGSLWGALADPQASIAVPMESWKSLDTADREDLMHYAASLVERMKADPIKFSQIPPGAPAAEMVRATAERMSPRSWVIHGGRLAPIGDSGIFDILTDETVATGAQTTLGG